jgi:predicted Zn-dependent protease
MPNRIRLPLALLLLVGCADIVSPPRINPYEHRIIEPDGEGGNTVLAFHWPRSSLPVKIWIAESDLLKPALERAIDIWEDNFLYGEFSAVIVGDQASADIVVRNQIEPAKVTAGGLRIEAIADECTGATDFDADPVAGTLTLPFNIYVSPKTAPDAAGLANCYELTVLHELGHAIGLFVHSPLTTDLMYTNPTRNGLSSRDQATAEAIYHLPATVTPVGR